MLDNVFGELKFKLKWFAGRVVRIGVRILKTKIQALVLSSLITVNSFLSLRAFTLATLLIPSNLSSVLVIRKEYQEQLSVTFCNVHGALYLDQRGISMAY